MRGPAGCLAASPHTRSRPRGAAPGAAGPPRVPAGPGRVAPGKMAARGALSPGPAAQGPPRERLSAARGLREPGRRAGRPVSAARGPASPAGLVGFPPSPSMFVIYIYIFFKGEEAAFKRRGSGGSRRTLPPCLQTQLLPCICNAKGKATSGEEQTRGWCGRGVLGIWKGQGALFLKLSIPSTPIVSASCKTSRAF